MMMSSNWNIFRVTGLCAGNSPVTGEFRAQRPVTHSFAVFFDLRLNKRLTNNRETPSCPMWRHSNEGIQSLEAIFIHISTSTNRARFYHIYVMLQTLVMLFGEADLVISGIIRENPFHIHDIRTMTRNIYQKLSWSKGTMLCIFILMGIVNIMLYQYGVTIRQFTDIIKCKRWPFNGFEYLY